MDVSETGWALKPITLAEAINSDAIVSVYLTGDLWNPEDAEGDEDYCGESGWVDPNWNRFEVLDSRNDVRPIFQFTRRDYLGWGIGEDEAAEMIRTDVQEALAAYGCSRSDDDGTFYADDEDTDYTTGRTITFAAHVSARFYFEGRVVEASVSQVAA